MNHRALNIQTMIMNHDTAIIQLKEMSHIQKI